MWEFYETWLSLENGWADELNKAGEDAWRVAAVVLDEVDQDGTIHEGRCRVIFQRPVRKEA